MIDAITAVPIPANEAVRTYAPGSSERLALQGEIDLLKDSPRQLLSIVGGVELPGDEEIEVTMPHRHNQVVANTSRLDAVGVNKAVEAALRAQREWSATPLRARAAVFLRAAELLAGKHRDRVLAATMLGQSKTVHQAEIDAACEMIDFLRFNVDFADKIARTQPCSSPGMWNLTDVRPLEGFVLAIAPFNFTSIAGNLCMAPALMGNVVIWKPATTAALAAQSLMDVFIEAGLPPGVINLIHARGADVSQVALTHPELSGIHFTGSTATFQGLWRTVGERIATYRGYPRLVGETGGKDFIVAHPSADPEALRVAIVRGGFEYQGQKCSAVSRVYVPASLWPKLREGLRADVAAIKVGDIEEPSVFMGAVIDREAFSTISGAVSRAVAGTDAKIVAGGVVDDKEGYFIGPTVVEVDDPQHRLMSEELFGPVVTVWVYDDSVDAAAAFSKALRLCDQTSPYALTGAVFSRDRAAVEEALAELRFAAGNFYINDKPTGAVVGQQPFGGARASGTNDKAGSALNLMRWVSPRTIKETLAPPTDWRYPYMGSELPAGT